MHIYFSGIGGTAIGPLAMIAQQAGYQVSGSDKQGSQYVDYLKQHGIEDIQLGQTYEQIAAQHEKLPIDWYVYSSAVAIENPDAPEFRFCQDNGIKMTKRDELLNKIISEKGLKLVAIAGTHGKTTTTAMAIWLCKQLNIPISYSVGAKIPFGEMGQFDATSEHFVYEADEFDHNFLAFHPHLSLITGVDWDHHEYFPTRESYQQAFRDFLRQSERSIVWQSDVERLQLEPNEDMAVISDSDRVIESIELLGNVNRRNAWQVINAVKQYSNVPVEEMIECMNRFPGLNRRFERITNNIYSDYAHTEEKIKGALQMAHEASQNVVVVYEPLTNRRQHYIKDAYKDLFLGVKKLYWIPSYLAREDASQKVLSPAELILCMDNKDVAEPAELNDSLKQKIAQHAANGDLVICMSGGGGGSLDEWLRQTFN